MLDVPTADVPRQRAKIDVPQMTHFRFHERFRWPADQVLLVSMGMVALPVPVDGKPIGRGGCRCRLPQLARRGPICW